MRKPDLCVQNTPRAAFKGGGGAFAPPRLILASPGLEYKIEIIYITMLKDYRLLVLTR